MSHLNLKHQSILKSIEFKKLVRRRWLVSLVFTLLILFIYIGFLLLVAFNKELLGSKISHNITLAIPVGMGIILLAWVLIGIYVYWANNSYDSAVQEIKDQIN